MPVETSTVLPALKNIATRLRIESIRATTAAGSGHPTTCCSAADIVAALFFAEMRYDPHNPQHPARRSLRAVEGPRGADSLRGLGGSRLHPARRAAQPARVHVRSRRPSDAAAAVRRRRDRIARPGAWRRRRHRAQRAAHRLGLSHLRADGRRRDRGRIGVGSGGDGASSTSSIRSARIVDVNGLGQSRPTQLGHDMEAHRRALGRLRLARDRDRRPRHGRRSSTRSPRRGAPRAGRR